MSFNRRSLLKGSAVAGMGLALPLFKGGVAGAATTQVNILKYGASVSNADNYSAIMNAINAAGAGGTVIVPAGVFKISQGINVPFKINILGLGNDDHMSTFDYRGSSTVWGLAFNIDAVNGSVVRNIAFEGCSSAQIFVGGPVSRVVNVDLCHFRDPQLFGVQLDGATLNASNSKTMGNGTNKGTAYYLGTSSSKATLTNCQITGVFQGVYAVGIDSVTVKGCKVNGMWWHMNRAVYGSTFSSVSATGFTLAKRVDGLTNGARNTVTAFEKVTASATLTPVAGRADWYTISGVTPEPRMMVSNKLNFGTIVSVEGSNVYIPFFFRWDTYHPITGPNVKTYGTTVERPYIGVLSSFDGVTGVIDGWRMGPNVVSKTPPSNARVQVHPPVGYQLFSTNQTKNYNVDSTLVCNSWTDSIATINSQNVSVTNCTVYDGQDVGLTLQLGTGTCYANNNKTYRQGTASIFIGTNNAKIFNNYSYGAQHIAMSNETYGAFQIEGAENTQISDNTLVWGGAPYEDRGMLFEGRYGAYASVGRPNEAPYAYNATVTNNSFVGYPSTLQHPIGNEYSGLKEVEITLRGTKTNVIHTVKPDGKTVRFQYLDGAQPSQVVQQMTKVA